MTLTSVTTTFTGTGENQGLQVGYNTGSIHYHMQAPSIPRPETPPQPSCFVPFPRDADFVDCGTLLNQIHRKCAAPASRIGLVGLGGVGKSQLAIELCYRTTEQSPSTWVFWAHASNTARLEQSFQKIADQIKVYGRKDPQADVFKLVYDWLGNAKNGQWLIVLDNVDDAAVFSPTGGGAPQEQDLLAKYIPLCRHGSVLLTSRTKNAMKQVIDNNEIILIEPMNDAAAHALLRKKLADIDNEDDSIAMLATTLDNMPLALVQAAAYIRERAPRCSVRQYLEEYQQSDCRKTSLLKREVDYLRRDQIASNSILITWQISFDHIRSTKQSAAGLLSLMSFFDRQGIQEALLRPKSSTVDDRFEDDLTTLRDYSFITVARDGDVFQMHSLVQLAMRMWLENEGQLDKWREQFISNLCAELPAGGYQNWEKCEALFPHARAALAHQPMNKKSLEEWALLLYRAASYARQRGRAGEAEEMATMSMEVRRKEFGEDDVEMLSSMGIVGLAKELQGKYREAEMICRQILAGFEKVLGREHPDTLAAMGNLATVLDRQGKHEDAEAMHRETVALSEKVLGHGHSATLTSINNLALMLASMGRYQEAETMNRETLVRREKVLGHGHPDTLTSINNLAAVLDKQGKYKEAEVMFRQALAGSEKVLGYEHPDTLTTANNLALILGRLGRYEDQEMIYRKTLARRKEVLGHEHPDTLMSLNNLAAVLNNHCKYEEAEAMFRQTLAGYEKTLGDEHLFTLKTMSCLAAVLSSQGKYEDAEAICRKTLAQRTKVLGQEHSDTLMSMSNLATILDSQGKHGEAEAICRDTLARREKALGHKHPETLASVGYLGYLLKSRHCYDEALALFERACAACELVLGKGHPNTHLYRQYYTETLALQEQHSRASVPTTAPDSSAIVRREKLWRGLAKMGMGSLKQFTGRG